MPKQNQTMTAREMEICERVHRIRQELAKWSQPDMALELGITQNQLAGIEYKRAPLPYEIGLHLCRKFDVSQRWLAKGIEPMQPAYEVILVSSLGENTRKLFSQGFDLHHDEETALMESAIIAAVGEASFRSGKFDHAIFAQLPPPGSSAAQGAAHFVKKLVDLYLNWLPDDLLLIYTDALTSANDKFCSEYAQRLAAAKSPSERKIATLNQLYEKQKQERLDIPSLVGDAVGVKPKTTGHPKTLQELLNAIRDRVSKRGQKAALAKHCEVSRQAVDQWLSGDAKPSADITFKLLAWLNDPA